MISSISRTVLSAEWKRTYREWLPLSKYEFGDNALRAIRLRSKMKLLREEIVNVSRLYSENRKLSEELRRARCRYRIDVAMEPRRRGKAWVICDSRNRVATEWNWKVLKFKTRKEAERYMAFNIPGGWLKIDPD